MGVHVGVGVGVLVCARCVCVYVHVCAMHTSEVSAKPVTRDIHCIVHSSQTMCISHFRPTQYV